LAASATVSAEQQNHRQAEHGGEQPDDQPLPHREGWARAATNAPLLTPATRREKKSQRKKEAEGQAALRRRYFRRCFSRNSSGCRRAYLRSLQRLEQINLPLRPSKSPPHSTHRSFAGVVRRAALSRSRFCSRHARVAAFEHTRHHELQSDDNRKLRRNSPNGFTSRQRVQRRPLGRTQYDGPIVETRRQAPQPGKAHPETPAHPAQSRVRLSLAKTWQGVRPPFGSRHRPTPTRFGPEIESWGKSDCRGNQDELG